MRFEAWERRLHGVIDMHGRQPFEWGRSDCVLFAADAVWALTQKDPAAAWRRAYVDEHGAAQIIAAHGGIEGLIDTGLATIGTFDKIKPSFAQRGDPVLYDAPGMLGSAGPGLGIAMGEWLFAKGKTGVERIRLDEAKATIAWAIR